MQEWGTEAVAASPAPQNCISWRRESEPASRGSGPCGRLAQSSPLHHPSALFPQYAPPCPQLLGPPATKTQPLSSGVGPPPLGSLPWLPPTLLSRGPSLGRSWVLAPLPLGKTGGWCLPTRELARPILLTGCVESARRLR